VTNPSRPLLPALTSARFFAAFHVLLYHLWVLKGLARAPWWFQRFASIGYVAVTFFFVLSGFVLVYTYAGKNFSLGAFWRARLARLYPVYLLVLLLVAPLYFYILLKFNIPQLVWPKAHVGLSFVLVLTMLQAWVPLAALTWNGVAWAVSVEIAFYGVFPILLARFSRLSNRSLAAISLGCWMMAIGAALTYVVLAPDHVIADPSKDFLPWLSVLKFSPLARMPEFIVGLTCGYWFLRGGLRPNLATPLVLGGTALALITTAFSHQIAYPILHTGLYAPAFAAIICGLALSPHWAEFLEGRWLLLLGQSSYALYLLHVTCIGVILYWGSLMSSKANQVAAPSIGPSLGRAVIAALTATFVAVLVFKFVEEPARKWLRGKPKPKAATPGFAVAA
jgi:peptidoglycan/LPS O-acetylase OafA/YrhL